MVTDPCYSPSVDCQHMVENMKSGTYIGVDSGTSGFFNVDKWEKVYADGRFEEFYDGVAHQCTLGDVKLHNEYKHAGVYEDWAFVSFSGLDDGGYPLYKVERDGKIVALMLDFLNVMGNN